MDKPFCSCGAPLKRYIADNPVEGETASTFPVQVADPGLPETEDAWLIEGFWAGSIDDAGKQLRYVAQGGQTDEVLTHDVRHPSGDPWRFGSHQPVPA